MCMNINVTNDDMQDTQLIALTKQKKGLQKKSPLETLQLQRQQRRKHTQSIFLNLIRRFVF